MALGISYITETRVMTLAEKDKLDEVLEYFHLKSSELKMTASETVEDEIRFCKMLLSSLSETGRIHR